LKSALAVTAAIALALAMAAGEASAQTPLTWDIRADNDAFNFWAAPFNRPDVEYTSGVRGALELSGAAPWERWFHGKITPCKVGLDRCATHSYAFGQDIYTGALVPGDTTRVAGARPNAGWLFIEESSKIAHRNSLDESSVTIGVTGEAAQGEFTQRVFHGIAPNYNRPTNWSSQLPFEPGIVVAYDHTQRLFAFGDGKFFGADAEPHAGLSAGNILTEARAGLRVRTGFRMSHPWLLSPLDKSSYPSLWFFGDATVHGVARNEFLAGTFFRSSEHVEERPFVTEYQVGASMRFQQLTLSWIAHQLSSEYESRAQGHAWSRLEIAWRFDR
jgi:hypothetical protein